MIFNVEPGSPARKAGLAMGDVIVKFNDKPVTEFYDLPRLLSGRRDRQRNQTDNHQTRNPARNNNSTDSSWRRRRLINKISPRNRPPRHQCHHLPLRRRPSLIPQFSAAQAVTANRYIPPNDLIRKSGFSFFI